MSRNVQIEIRFRANIEDAFPAEPADGYIRVPFTDAAKEDGRAQRFGGYDGATYSLHAYAGMYAHHTSIDAYVAALNEIGIDTRHIEVKRWRNVEWRKREQARFNDREYARLPWLLPDSPIVLEPIPDHFAHVSGDDPTQVAFTPDANKGELDLQTRMKAGRYLKRFYPDLTGDQVRELALLLDKDLDVKFATESADIVTLYQNGPRSCMAHDASEYEGHVHPCFVYGAGDLAIAYLGSIHAATARAVVWPSKKIWGRMYGDEIRLKAALEAQGYGRGTGAQFKGARLLKIENEDGCGYIMPYMDSPMDCISDAGAHWVIDPNGVCAQETRGVFEDEPEPYAHCENCNDAIADEYDARTVRTGHRGQYHETWCEHCADHDTFYCEGMEEVCSDSVPHVTTADGCTYTEHYFEEVGGFICDGNGEAYIDPDDAIVAEDTGRTFNVDYATDHLYHSEADGLWYEVKPEGEDDREDAAEAATPAAPRAPRRIPIAIGATVCVKDSAPEALTRGLVGVVVDKICSGGWLVMFAEDALPIAHNGNSATDSGRRYPARCWFVWPEDLDVLAAPIAPRDILPGQAAISIADDGSAGELVTCAQMGNYDSFATIRTKEAWDGHDCSGMVGEDADGKWRGWWIDKDNLIPLPLTIEPLRDWPRPVANYPRAPEAIAA